MIKEKYIMSNTIKISLSNPKSTAFKKKEFIFYHKIKEVVKLIDSRIDEIEKEEDKEKNPLIRFKNLRMHDAILIDGKRGSGKTTYLHNIEKVLEKKRHKSKVKVLGAIDPNQLDEKSNILLIIIANIYTELLDSVKNDNGDKELFKSLNIEINNLTSSIRTAEDRIYTDSYDHLYGLHKNLTIDEELHSFFLQVCDFYGVKALILPIDDIDMDFKHGYKVLDTIRKYLSTPKIIPIIAVDTAQAYALVKKEHYEYFSYDARTEKGDIAHGSELGFLRKLPNEYLQKILKPTRRVMLPDMLDIYKSHLRAKNNEKSNKIDKKIIFTYKTKNLKFKIKFDILLARYMNVVYGFGGEKIDDPDYYRVVNYLKNKSLRSFFEDMIAFLNGFSSKGNDDYQFDIEPLKERLIPNYMVKFHNKYDATEWVWDYYIEKLEKVVMDSKNRWKDIRETRIFVNILKNMMIIDSKELHIRSRNEKSYARLFMQDFFVKCIKIDVFKKNDDGIIEDFNIIKQFKLGGLIELILRTFVPMSIFETLVNEGQIDIFKFNYEEFSRFSRDNISNNLKDSMHELSAWRIKYKPNQSFNNQKIKKYNFIGIEVDEHDTYKHKRYATFFERIFLDNTSRYYLSPLKYYSFLSEYFKILEDHNIEQENKKVDIRQLKQKYNDLFNTLNYEENNHVLGGDSIDLVFNNTNIGILSIIKFSKDLSKNILETTNISYNESYFTDDIQNNIKEKNINNDCCDYKMFINKNIANYKVQFYNHLIIYLFRNTSMHEKMDLNSDYIYAGTREKDYCRCRKSQTNLLKNIYKLKQDKKSNPVLITLVDRLGDYLNNDYAYKNTFYHYNYLDMLFPKTNTFIREQLEEYRIDEKEFDEITEQYIALKLYHLNDQKVIEYFQLPEMKKIFIDKNNADIKKLIDYMTNTIQELSKENNNAPK